MAWDATGRERPDVALPPERRQVTVLFADLVGFTAMSRETDPEQMVEILGAYFSVIDTAVLRQGGRLDKHIGDALMAVFGVPVAYGDEVLRACRAAVAIHEGLEGVSRRLGREVRAHVGIATGEVLAGVVGSEHLARYTVLGDAPNLASRLDSLAQANETLVSEEVRLALGEVGRFDSRGEVAIKGFDRPIGVWRLVALVEATEPPLVGREAELEALSGTGHLALTGEPGIGKSALLRSAAGRAQREGRPAMVLATPHAVLTEEDRLQARLARAVADALFGASPELADAYREALPETDAAGWYDLLLAEPNRAIEDLLAATPPDARQARRQRVLCGLVGAWAAAGPALIGVDDAHHLDEVDRSLLEALVAAELPVLWVSAGRQAIDGARCMTLDPLGEVEARALLASCGVDDPARVDAIVERAAGVPFVLTQLALAPGDSLPGTIQSLVLTRLDALAPADRRGLQVAAVLGSRFPRALLGELAPEADPDRLVGAGFLADRGGVLAFDQELLRDGAYAATLKAERRRLHRAAADWYGADHPELRAEQLERGESPDAAGAWLEAARIRRAGQRLEHALELAARGSRIAAPGPVAIALAFERIQLSIRLHRLEAARELLDGLPELDAAVDRALALVERAEVDRLTYRYTEVLAQREARRRMVEAAGSPRLLARWLRLQAGAAFHTGESEQQRVDAEEGLALAREAGDVELELQLESTLADYGWVTGRHTMAWEHNRRLMGRANQAGLPAIATANAIVRTSLLFVRGEGLQAIDEARHYGELAEELLMVRSRLFSGANTMLYSGMTGDFELARRTDAWLSEVTLAHGLSDLHVFLAAYRCHERIWSGHRAEAAADLLAALPAIEKMMRRVFGAWARGALYCATDDPAVAERALTEGRARALDSRALGALMFYLYSIEGALDRGERDLATELVGELEVAYPEPAAVVGAVALRGRALLSEDPAELRAARQAIARCHLVPMLARLDDALSR